MGRQAGFALEKSCLMILWSEQGENQRGEQMINHLKWAKSLSEPDGSWLCRA